MLCPAAELTFDDAPWMSATLRGRGGGAEAAGSTGGPRFVHEAVGAELA